MAQIAREVQDSVPADAMAPPVPSGYTDAIDEVFLNVLCRVISNR